MARLACLDWPTGTYHDAYLHSGGWGGATTDGMAAQAGRSPRPLPQCLAILCPAKHLRLVVSTHMVGGEGAQEVILALGTTLTIISEPPLGLLLVRRAHIKPFLLSSSSSAWLSGMMSRPQSLNNASNALE